MRESMSRPSASVPSGKAQLPPSYQAGGSFTDSRNCSSGECGARTSAKIAVKTISERMTRPATAPLFSRKEAQNSAKLEGCAAELKGAARVTSAAMTDPWVDGAIEHVDEKVDDDHYRRDQHDAALQGGIIAARDRIDQPMADARPGEDIFGEHRASHQAADLEADDRDHRDQRVA